MGTPAYCGTVWKRKRSYLKTIKCAEVFTGIQVHATLYDKYEVQYNEAT